MLFRSIVTHVEMLRQERPGWLHEVGKLPWWVAPGGVDPYEGRPRCGECDALAGLGTSHLGNGPCWRHDLTFVRRAHCPTRPQTKEKP